MIGKIIAGSSFDGTVGYVMKQDATILDSEGVTPPEVAEMVRDFQDQTMLNPRVKNTVGHISLSFSEQDKAKLTDKAMTEIAREYMQKMGIENTQYIIVRHHDADHPHCHIVYNRVKNDGTTVTDSNIRRRNVDVCKELTRKHGLYFASGKENVNDHRLREPDKTKYEIYRSITAALPSCRSWGDLEKRLRKDGIGIEFKTKGETGIREGVKFTKGQFTFSGSKIDKQFSYSKLDKHFAQVQRAYIQSTQPRYSVQSQKGLQTAVGKYTSAFGGCFSSCKGGGSQIDLSLMGGGHLPLPPMNSGVGISAAQLQRQPGETPEHHIARITALINSVTEVMLTLIAERKRKQEQVQKPKSAKISH